MSLTAKQARFVEEYLIDLNATQAAIRAGYSKKTAGQQGFDLLKKPEIADAIAQARDDRSKRTELTQDMVIQKLWEEARYDGEGSSHAARVSALSWLGKHFAAFTDKVDHSGHIDTGVLAVPQPMDDWEEVVRVSQEKLAEDSANRVAALVKDNGKRGNGGRS